MNEPDNGACATGGGLGHDPPDQARPLQLAEEQAALRRVATLVARGTAPEQVFAAVIEEVGRLLPVDVVSMSHYQAEGVLTFVARWGKVADRFPLGYQRALGGRNVGTLVYETGRPARVDGYADVAASGPIGAISREAGLLSSVGSPIIVDGRLWGMIAAGSTLERLPADTEARLASFTELVATAIANAESRAALARVAEEQAALRRVATLVARAAPPRDVFAAVAAEAGQLLDVDATVLSRYDPRDCVTTVGAWTSTGAVPPTPLGSQLALGGRNVTTLVFRTGQAERTHYTNVSGVIGDLTRDWGLRSSVGVPIRVDRRLWGIMIVASAREEPLATDTEERLARFTDLVATAIANAEARAEVVASRARIVAAGDEARRRIERDLHDGIQQRLVTQALMLNSIRDRVPADVRADVDELSEELAITREELRDLSQGVHPSILVEVGLGAIRALARRSPLPVRVQLRAEGRLPSSVEITAYYVAAEALTNAAKHANASTVDILLEEANGTLTVQVRDDGGGGADASRGSGLTGLRDRVEAVGGSMTLDSAAGVGTVLTVLLPVTAGDQ